METTTLLLACAASLLAGFVDAMVGGGGLIQLPALLLLFPDRAFADISSVNKMASFAGTCVAAVRYFQRVRPEPARLTPGVATALLASSAGAYAASNLDTGFMRPLAAVVLACVATYTFVRKDFGALRGRAALPGIPQVAKVVVLCGVVGFYDGFFGPGTGSFFVFLLVFLFGLDFLAASAEAKAFNLATNVAAIATFAVGGHFHPSLFIPLAACNVAGSVLGTRLAFSRGTTFVRKVFLVVVLALLARLVWDVVGS